MPKAALSASFCATARPAAGKKRTDYYDTAITGFTLEVRPSGLKVFVLRYFNEYGKQCQRKIGVLGDITFAQAQKIAKKLRAEVVMGGDPAARKADKKAVPTYQTLANEHLAFARNHLRRPENVDRVMRSHLLPRWKDERVDTINPKDVAKWLSDKRKQGLAASTVEKIRVTFGRSFELGLKWNTPGITQNPVRSVPRQKVPRGRVRYLTSAEANRLIEASKASLNPSMFAIVSLLLLGGMRKNELLQTRWRDVDLERGQLFIPQSKTGTSRFVPLSEQAIEIIKGLPRYAGCEWMIVNPKTKKPLTDIKHPWQTLRKAAGLDDLRIHDLRHAAASFMVQAGIDLFCVGRVLGHADHASTMIYAHLADSNMKNAVEAGAAKMAVAWSSASDQPQAT